MTARYDDRLVNNGIVLAGKSPAYYIPPPIGFEYAQGYDIIDTRLEENKQDKELEQSEKEHPKSETEKEQNNESLINYVY